MKRLMVAVLVPLVFLSACGEPAYTEGDDAEYSNDNGEKSDIPDGLVYIKKVDVDGTECVIYRDGSMGGVTCNWIVGPADPALDTETYQ